MPPAIANHDGTFMTIESISEGGGSEIGTSVESAFGPGRPLAGLGPGRSFGGGRRRDDHPGLFGPSSRYWPVLARCVLPSLLPCGSRHVAGRAHQDPQNDANGEAAYCTGGAPAGKRAAPGTDRDQWRTMQAEEASANRRLTEEIQRVQKPHGSGGTAGAAATRPPASPLGRGVGDATAPSNSPQVQRPRPRHQARRPADNQPRLFDQDDQE